MKRLKLIKLSVIYASDSLHRMNKTRLEFENFINKGNQTSFKGSWYVTCFIDETDEMIEHLCFVRSNFERRSGLTKFKWEQARASSQERANAP